MMTANMLAMIQSDAARHSAASASLTIAVDGNWNSRITGRVGSCRSSTTVLSA